MISKLIAVFGVLCFGAGIASAFARADNGPGYGGDCGACVFLSSPDVLVPCSEAWRALMEQCAKPECSAYRDYFNSAPDPAKCTNTPNPLPGGTAGVTFSFGTLIPPTRTSAPNPTGSSGLSVTRSTPTGSGGDGSATRSTISGTTTTPRGEEPTTSATVRTSTTASTSPATGGGSRGWGKGKGISGLLYEGFLVAVGLMVQQ